MSVPNRILVNFERLLGQGSINSAKVLGVAYTTYAPWRNGSRKIPRYIKHSILAISRLDELSLDDFTHKMIATYEKITPKDYDDEL